MKTERKAEENDKVFYTDADEKIILMIIKEIEAVPRDRIIDWELFKPECYECIPVPMSVIERCLPQAKERAVIFNNEKIN